MPVSEAVDVVVVGSGAGGAPVAAVCAEAGASVALIERGPRYAQSQFVHDEIRIARRNFFVPSAETDPHVVVVKGQKPERSNDGWVALCVGGGTVHMSGFFYRFKPEDFRVRTLLGGIAGAEPADWPITYEALAPFYDQVDREVGVSGPESEGPHAAPRSGPYPLPALDVHPAAELIDEAARQVGVTAFATPRAIVSRDYQGRSACRYCHLCGGFGCEVSAKSSTLASLVPRAEATSRCQVVANAMVYEVTLDAQGRASGVIYRDLEGRDHALGARVVVIACSAIETARLLLLSRSARFPNGLANDQGLVGRHLMFSTLAKAHGAFAYERDPERAELLQDHAPFVGRSVLDYYLPRQKDAPRKAGALNFLFPSGGPISQSEMLAVGAGGASDLVWGRALKARLRQYWLEERQIDCESFGEYLPTPGTRVELDPEVKDRFGLPAARISIDRHPHDLAVSSFLGARAAELLAAAGADRVWQSSAGGRTMHLPMGGCRMGKDPSRSVVDANCRAHAVPNLYVTDGSVFPSSGGVPPTYTIMANAFRVGQVVRDVLARRDLP